MKGFNRLFIDIETSYNKCASWRIGYNLNLSPDNILEGGERFIIMASWKWEGKKKIHNNFCTPKLVPHTIHLDGELTEIERLEFDDDHIVQELVDAFDVADEIVYQNGDRFDMKWVRTRAMFHGIPMNPKYQTFDTLKKSNNLYLNSRRLGYANTYFGGEGKLETGGLGLWKDVVEKNCPKARKKMTKYCDRDVLELEDYFKKLSPYVVHNAHVGVRLGSEKYSCPDCGNCNVRMKKHYTTAAGADKYQMMCDNHDDHPSGMSRYYTISGASYNKLLKNELKGRGG